ncbi:MAG: phytanoyl-CoA dioxygenase family protein [Pyrinomonadaceae bacterium]|nr:phytanoyl-CoA dioxygenase family protein [Pyrinomonadaceae bacterium]
MTAPEGGQLLSEVLIAAFRRDGHVLVNGVATKEEIVKYAPTISAASYRNSTEQRPMEERDTYGKAFLQVMNLWRSDDEVREFVFEKRFARIAAELLGVERVRLYHDQALFKEPGGGLTPWHQDQYYWPLDTTNTVTMWMPLTDIDEEMGMLTFASGSHKFGAIGSLAISDESEAAYNAYIAEKGFPITKAERMAAGDATFHYGWTIHSAGANRSTRPREVMTVIYFADGARVTPPANSNQVADMEAWLGGRIPGEIADSEMNPVLN